MEGFVAWLSQLSPLTIYLVIGASTLVENIFPPTPSDVAVALGGFLTQHASVAPVIVWLVAWLANVAGTIFVYLVARRHGRRFVSGPLGRRLLPADAILDLERDYLRFGVVGIFFARLLPGFRSFVAPFVGLVNLGPVPAILPMVLAAGLWYGFLTWAGVRLGAEWETINRFLHDLNRTLAIVAGTIGVALLWWFWRRSREAGPRRRRLLQVVRDALGGDLPEGPQMPESDLATQGAAALLFELTHGDPGFSIEERSAIAGFLRERWGIGRQPLPPGSGAHHVISDTTELAAIVTERYDLPRRVELAERLYRIALGDGTLSRHEERLMRRVGDLLGLTPEHLAEARRRASP